MINASPEPLETIERIEHVIPRISDRRERERRGRPFPELEEGPGDNPSEDTPSGEAGGGSPLEKEAPAMRRPREESGGEEHRVDLVVRGRFLPTGQDLPSDARDPILH